MDGNERYGSYASEPLKIAKTRNTPRSSSNNIGNRSRTTSESSQRTLGSLKAPATTNGIRVTSYNLLQKDLKDKENAANGWNGTGKGRDAYTPEPPESKDRLLRFRQEINVTPENVRPTDWDVDTHIDEKDKDPNAWIHRDKLVQIERQELKSAGILIPSETDLAPKKHHHHHHHEEAEDREDQENYRQSGEFKRQRIDTPENVRRTDWQDEEPRVGTPDNVRPVDWTDDEGEGKQEEGRYYDPNIDNNDLRSPEEIAEELAEFEREMELKKNGSRLPRALTSPIPVPKEYLLRPVPLNRPPFETSDGKAEIVKPRRRSYSASAAQLLDSKENSPSKSANATPTKKKPVNKAIQKKRTRSNPHLHGSRSSNNPATSSKAPPEGPPPWAFGTYKPDPSLPPDQQIIPTVAKRLQQEQWEKEGKFASVYDRKLRPLTVHEEEELARMKKQQEEDRRKQMEEEAASRQNGSGKRRSRTSKLFESKSPQPQPEPKEEPEPVMEEPRNEQPAMQPVKVPEAPETKQQEKEKKFCCCIVM
ncbi:hypothetical protein BJ508DRAFT_17112 [Ascobolus immersus RN42]|uniref:Uncharacterized protein n=1 Tax=Ascobolus immersus RN42 TaxID=1160509 RepID=A0A3N4HPJ1_ASCIM|nr:hypothetical protein BJ508DRAFT_17112 [Ascobolus immersus RN42]